ncbi:MAG: ROK family protein [Rikenellaceae bacterium]
MADMKGFIKLLNSQSRGVDLLKKTFLHCLNNGSATIPEIAKTLNHSVPAITKHVMDLCDMDYFIDLGKVEAKEGRPANRYGINADSCFFIGVDIRQLSLNIGIMNLAGEIIKLDFDKTFILEDTREVLDDICKRVNQFISSVCVENNSVSRDKIFNINVNIGGRVNSDTGYSFSLFNTGEKPLSEVIGSKLKQSVTIENDTRAMAYGEFKHKNNTNINNMLFVNVGYGIGMGLIINGEIYGGKSGFAGEFGHMSVFNNEVICFCGKKGCLETEISCKALLRKVRIKMENGSESTLSKKVAKNKQITIYDILDAVNKNEDMLCIEIVEEIGAKLGRQLANMINLFNPDKIVIGGLLSTTGDYLLHPIITNINKYAFTLVSKDTKIAISELQHKAGVIGACMLARDQVIRI